MASPNLSDRPPRHGYRHVSYPERIPLELADADRDIELTLVTSGTVGEVIDLTFIESGAVDRRFSCQSATVARTLTTRPEVAFGDRNPSSIGHEVQYGGLVAPDLAFVEAVAVAEGWLVHSTSLGQLPAFVDAAITAVTTVATTSGRTYDSRCCCTVQELRTVYPVFLYTFLQRGAMDYYLGRFSTRYLIEYHIWSEIPSDNTERSLPG